MVVKGTVTCTKITTPISGHLFASFIIGQSFITTRCQDQRLSHTRNHRFEVSDHLKYNPHNTLTIQPIVDTLASFSYTLDIPVVICCQDNGREPVPNQQSLIYCNYASHAGGIINSDLEYRKKFEKNLCLIIFIHKNSRG